MRNSPVVVHGVGPRLRVYCVYDEDAILEEGVSEEPLAWWAYERRLGDVPTVPSR